MLLRGATEEERQSRDVLTFATWGAVLSLPEYLERERVLRAHPWAAVAMETWLLCDGATIVCSCESFGMTSRIGDQPGTSWGIASVFTEPFHRGHRHASLLVDQVAARLLDREPTSQAVVLYSEVGAAIYERAGFFAVPTFEWRVPAAPSARVEGLILDDVLEAGAWPELGQDQIAIWPSPTQLDWHLCRERFFAAKRNRRAPGRHRLRLGEDFVLVAADLKHGELLGLLAHVSPDTVESLMRAVGDLAWQLGLSGVRLWEPEGASVPSFVERNESDASLPMLRARQPLAWRGPAKGIWV